MLTAIDIQLRLLEQNDLDFLYTVENDESLWEFGSENRKYTKEELTQYISNAKQDILLAKQSRFVIEYNSKVIGFIDLFDYDEFKASVGVLIVKEYQNRGFAKQALLLLINHAFKILNITQLCCSIHKTNIASISLFTSCKFKFMKEEKNFNYYYLNNE